MKLNEIIDDLLLELSLYHPIPDLGNETHAEQLIRICEDKGYTHLIPELETVLLREKNKRQKKKEASKAAASAANKPAEEKTEAEKLGLIWLGGPYYGPKEGQPATHMSKEGKIEPMTDAEKAEKAKADAEKAGEKPEETPTEPKAEEPKTEAPPEPKEKTPEEKKREADLETAKTDPAKVLADPTASAQSQAIARDQQAKQSVATATAAAEPETKPEEKPAKAPTAEEPTTEEPKPEEKPEETKKETELKKRVEELDTKLKALEDTLAKMQSGKLDPVSVADARKMLSTAIKDLDDILKSSETEKKTRKGKVSPEEEPTDGEPEAEVPTEEEPTEKKPDETKPEELKTPEDEFKQQAAKAQADFAAADKSKETKEKGYDFPKLAMNDEELNATEAEEKTAAEEARLKGDKKAASESDLKIIQTRLARAKKAGNKKTETALSDEYRAKKAEYDKTYGEKPEEKPTPTETPAETPIEPKAEPKAETPESDAVKAQRAKVAAAEKEITDIEAAKKELEAKPNKTADDKRKIDMLAVALPAKQKSLEKERSKIDDIKRAENEKKKEDIQKQIEKEEPNPEQVADVDQITKKVKDPDPVGTEAKMSDGQIYVSQGGGHYGKTVDGPHLWKIVDDKPEKLAEHYTRLIEQAIESDSPEDWYELFEAQTATIMTKRGPKKVVKVGQSKTSQKVASAVVKTARKADMGKKSTPIAKPKDKPAPKKAEKRKLTPEETVKLKKEFSQKTETTEGLFSNQYKTLPNGTVVRQLVDESGNVIDVSTDEGRKTAISLLENRIKTHSKKTNTAIQNFDQNLVVIQKWLGELGEITALKQTLESGVEAYMLTDSERKNDLVFIKPNGKEGGFYIGYISAKTTKGEGGVNKRGANCKADFEKLCESGKPEYEVDGIKLKPTNVLGSVIDVKSGLFKKYTQGTGEVIQKVKYKKKDGTEAQEKLVQYDPKRHGKVDAANLIRAKNGKPYFKDLTTFMRNRPLTSDDVGEFFAAGENDKYYTNLSVDEQNPRKNQSVSDTTDLNNTKEYLKKTLLSEIKRRADEGKPFSLYDLHEWMYGVVGSVVEDSGMQIGATGDTAAIRYVEGNPEPQIGIITKDSANQGIDEVLAEVNAIQEQRERRIQKARRAMGLNSRVRVLGDTSGSGKGAYLDGIDNNEPVADLDQTKETPIKRYVNPAMAEAIRRLTPGMRKKLLERLRSMKVLLETTSNGGYVNDNEPNASHIPDGKLRKLNSGKPENWFPQLGFTQLETPKADRMRAKAIYPSPKDKETQYRKLTYKVQNVVSSALNPAEKKEGVDQWKTIKDPAKQIRKRGEVRYWDLEDTEAGKKAKRKPK